MATDPTTIPSVEDLQKTKKSMTDIDTFVDSGNDSFTDNNGQTRRTLTGINSEITQQLLEINKSRGFRVVGTFAAGFDYELFNDVGIDASGNSWIYVGAGAPEKTVTAGTVPSAPDYQQVTFNGIDGVVGLRSALNGFDTVAAMRAGTSIADDGNEVKWGGYYVKNDGGGNKGIVKTGDSTSLVDDGGSIFVIVNDAVNGVWVESKLKGQRLNIRKFGVFGGANCTTQMQNALNYGIKDLKIPRGVYEFDQLTLPDYVNLEGVTAQAGVGGGDRVVEFRFNLTDTSNAITCGAEPTLKKIIFVNTGGTYNELTKTLSGTSAGGIKLQDNIAMEDCAFYLWHQCFRTGPSTFYMNTNRVEFNRCTSGYVCEDTSPYNMNIYSPKSSLTEYFIVGVGNETPRDVKVFGGAIEGYTSAFIRCVDVSLFGVYFETVPERSAFSVIDPQLNNTRVSMFGCTIFVNHTSRFINASGIENVSITAAGNTFTGVASGEFIPYFLPVSGSMNIGGDSVDPSIAPNFRYVSSITQAAELGGITMPRLPATAPESSYSGVHFLGQSGAIQKAWGSEPAVKISGQQFLADGAGWDPLSLAQGRPYFVIWQGDRWRSVSG